MNANCNIIQLPSAGGRAADAASCTARSHNDFQFAGTVWSVIVDHARASSSLAPKNKLLVIFVVVQVLVGERRPGPGRVRQVRAPELMCSHSRQRPCRLEHLPVLSARMPLDVDARDIGATRHSDVALALMWWKALVATV
jgi:hypothetical protein